MLPDNILFTNSPADDLRKFLAQKNYSKIAILTDENTSRFCLPLLEDAIVPRTGKILIRSGEEQKNISTCILIWQEMTELALDRHSALVVVGGGVLGDMGGFCASTYKRGIDFILIPTTLLAQVDASIGGKLGVDFNSFKNHIGVFQSPALTLLYSGFLNTLPTAELRSGFAEVVKHCLISDKNMWRQISIKELEKQNWEELLKHSVEFKARITTEDPKEKGVRKILNAGHTIGHAIESFLLSENRRILHGEAIAIGLIAEAYIAADRGLLSGDELKEICDYIIRIFGKIEISEDEIHESAELTIQDKKNKDNKILCALIDGIGRCRWDQEITLDEVSNALRQYRSL